MAMSPDKKDYGHHNYPLERFGKAIGVLQEKGCSRIGIVGASTTGMLALLAASYYPQISMTIAISPPDFVMEGFYQDGKDGMRERPGDNESSVSWEGKPLPYLPYAYRHPEYWQKIKEASKAGKDMVASRRKNKGRKYSGKGSLHRRRGRCPVGYVQIYTAHGRTP